MSKKDLFEIAATQSSAQYDNHKAMIQKMIAKGYTITEHDQHEEHGLNQELLATVEETTLHPPMSVLPIIRFEAREIFGHYNFDKGEFTKLEIPKFELKAYKKSAEFNKQNEPWDKFEL